MSDTAAPSAPARSDSPADSEASNAPSATSVAASPLHSADAALPLLAVHREHSLETPWTFFFDRKLQTKAADYKNFEQNLHKLGQFDTVEGFWRHFAYLNSPDTLPRDHNVSMFRHNYIPAWEVSASACLLSALPTAFSAQQTCIAISCLVVGCAVLRCVLLCRVSAHSGG